MEGSRGRTTSLATGIAGIAALLLLFGAQGLMQVGGGEPAFDAQAGEIGRFFATRNPTLFAAGSYLSLIGLVAFLWFVVGVTRFLSDADGEGRWRASVASGCGVVVVAAGFVNGWELGAFRVDGGLDPQLARTVFDMGNLWFANSWVALGSFSLVSGWIIASNQVLPRWLGWWAIVAGGGLVAARAIWTTPAWVFPYALFWIWVTVLSVRFVRSGRAFPISPRRVGRRTTRSREWTGD